MRVQKERGSGGPVPYNVYLTNLYGNYMEIPPENRREVHTGFLVRT